jgi:hypothetical protein
MRPGGISTVHAIVSSLVVSGVFEAALLVSKETPAIYDHAPWVNDPYDTAVSFALFCVPLVAVPSALRLLADRAGQADRAGRADHAGGVTARLADLLRACGVALAVVAVTLAVCWAAVAKDANRPAWNAATAIQVGALALLSAATVVCALGIRRAAATLRRDSATAQASRPAPGTPPAADAATTSAVRPVPDWLGDLTIVGRMLADLAGPAGRPVTRLLDWADSRVLPCVRLHPVCSAAAIGVVVGLAVTISQSVNEGYRAGVALAFFCIVTLGVFAFVATAGWYLRVVRADRPADARAPLIHATVLAAAAVPVALAFRATLLALVGASPQASGLPALGLLLASAALLAFAASLAAERFARARRRG